MDISETFPLRLPETLVWDTEFISWCLHLCLCVYSTLTAVLLPPHKLHVIKNTKQNAQTEKSHCLSLQMSSFWKMALSRRHSAERFSWILGGATSTNLWFSEKHLHQSSPIIQPQVPSQTRVRAFADCLPWHRVSMATQGASRRYCILSSL